MDRDFFKFSLGAIAIIAASIVAFYFLAELRYDQGETAEQTKIEAGAAIAPLIGE